MLTPLPPLCEINFLFPKRNKGKARKAKAKDIQNESDANENDDETKEMIVLRSLFTRRWQDVTLCSHSCPPLPADHVGNELLEALVNRSYKACVGESSDRRSGQVLTQAFEEFESKHHDILADSSIRELVRKSFLGRSIDIVLQREDDLYLMAAGMLASASLLLEIEPNSVLSEGLSLKKKLKLADILEGDKRSLIEFFSGRINCNCLDKMRKDSTTLPKSGMSVLL